MRNVHDARDGNAAFIRAAERRRDVAAHADASLPRLAHDSAYVASDSAIDYDGCCAG